MIYHAVFTITMTAKSSIFGCNIVYFLYLHSIYLATSTRSIFPAAPFVGVASTLPYSYRYLSHRKSHVYASCLASYQAWQTLYNDIYDGIYMWNSELAPVVHRILIQNQQRCCCFVGVLDD
jgi:hypothetical protein